MKKKFLMVFLCIMMVAALATGCASNGQSSSSADTKTVEPVAKTKVFVSADWVKSVISGKQAESKDYKIIEVAWGPAADDKDYNKAHIPGALHLNTDDIEESHYWNIRPGDEIKKVMANYGITKDTTVIIYGADSGATRAAFVCLHPVKDSLRYGFCTDYGFCQDLSCCRKVKLFHPGQALKTYPTQALLNPLQKKEWQAEQV